jgi:hypothetical protein
MANAAKATDKASTEVAPIDTTVYSPEALHSGAKRIDVDFSQLKTSDDVMRALLAEFGEIIDVSEFGDGFVPVDKSELVGHKLMIIDTTFVEKDIAQGKTGDYVVVRAFDVRTGNKVVFADGSTGIFAQLKSIVSQTRKRGGFGIPNGLRVSDYVYTDEKGEQSPAKTYYLDESPAS